jgi:transcriptional repressor NrdR
MKCPSCGYEESKVIDSRSMGDGIRRRRQCLKCGSRFTTSERLQSRNLFVIKKDGRREEFNRDKILAGIRKACEKRPLPTGTIDKLVDNIEYEIYRLGKSEIPTASIGDMVIERLERLDHIAHIRFASVYHEFTDITTLKQAVDNLVDNKTKGPPAGQLPLISHDELATLNLRRRGQKK